MRPALGEDLLRAFDTYFANEQANLEALGTSADEHPEFLAFYQERLTAQRRSLAELSFRVASLLPESKPKPDGVSPDGVSPDGVWATLTTTVQALRARPFVNGFATGTAAIAVAVVVLAATREAVLTPSSPIGPRIADAAPEIGRAHV